MSQYYAIFWFFLQIVYALLTRESTPTSLSVTWVRLQSRLPETAMIVLWVLDLAFCLGTCGWFYKLRWVVQAPHMMNACSSLLLPEMFTCGPSCASSDRVIICHFPIHFQGNPQFTIGDLHLLRRVPLSEWEDKELTSRNSQDCSQTIHLKRNHSVLSQGT